MILLEGERKKAAVVEFGWAKLEKRTSRQSTADLIRSAHARSRTKKSWSNDNDTDVD